MKNSDFDQTKYWEGRVGAESDLGVVGHRSLGRAYNEYIYRRRTDVLTTAIKELRLDLSTSTVLDVGVGSGYYVDFWQKSGIAALVGIDLSRSSIDQLRRKYGKYTFQCADITNPSMAAIADLRFSIITLFDVLYHIVNDADAQQALNSIAELLSPEGYVLVFDHVMKRDYMLREHVKYRSTSGYARMLKRAGLEIVKRMPLFVLLEPPVVGWKPLDIIISGTYAVIGLFMQRWDRLGHFIGSLVYHLDSKLGHIGVRTPNHELLILQKRVK